MDTLTVMQKVVPELKDVLERRYTILRAVRTLGPVGRRNLTHELGLSERTVRSDLDILRAQGLVLASSEGVLLSPEGEVVLARLDEMARKLHDVAGLEAALGEIFGLQRVIVVPGDSDSDPSVKRDMAQVAGEYLRSILRDGDILAVTGGLPWPKWQSASRGRALTGGSQSYPRGAAWARISASKPTLLLFASLRSLGEATGCCMPLKMCSHVMWSRSCGNLASGM